MVYPSPRIQVQDLVILIFTLPLPGYTQVIHLAPVGRVGMFKLHLHCKWWDLHHNNRLYGRILSDANLRWGLSSCPLGTGTWLPVLVGKRSSWEGYRQIQRICPSFRFRKVYPTWFPGRKSKNPFLQQSRFRGWHFFRHSFPLEADRSFPAD